LDKRVLSFGFVVGLLLGSLVAGMLLSNDEKLEEIHEKLATLESVNSQLRSEMENIKAQNTPLDKEDITTHKKLLIIDCRYTVVGSTNWSLAAIDSNNEASVFIDSQDIANQFTLYFLKLWSQYVVL